MSIQIVDYSNLDLEAIAKPMGLQAKHVPLIVSVFIDDSLSMLNDLEIAIDKKDYESMKQTAHSIKGSAGNLRFDAVHEMAQEMEFAADKMEEQFDYEAYFKAIKTAINTISV